MKRMFQVTGGLLFLCVFSCRVQAGFTSMHVFGDGVSTMTNSPGGEQYYGRRFCNGRVWVEVLAQRQGLVLETNKNWSFFGHYSPNLVTNVTNWGAPPDVATAVVVIWINNADFVDYMTRIYPSLNITTWTNAMNQSLSNHAAAIQTLYGKGVRTLVMPNAVDITKVPFYVGTPAADKAFVRQRIMDYNAALASRLSQTQAVLPGLTIHSPDFFSLLDAILARPADYGLTNALDEFGYSIDALSDPALVNKALNGPGTNYIFWDYLDPTAKASSVMAELTQQILAPVKIMNGVALGNSLQLALANVPIGLNGFVDGSTNLQNWVPVQGFSSTNLTQSVTVPVSDQRQFYRLRFPFAWSWP